MNCGSQGSTDTTRCEPLHGGDVAVSFSEELIQ